MVDCWRNKPGYFISVEGPDGAGKTTQTTELVRWLGSLGVNLLSLREPGGTEISLQIRQVLMDMKNKEMKSATEFLLFSAARAQLVEEKIKPHLATGGVVVCDRYTDSSMAYQGYGHGLPKRTIKAISNFATGGLTPDTTLLLNIDPEMGLQRRKTGGAEWNRLDASAVKFHRKVSAGYLQIACQNPDRIETFDAHQRPELLQGLLRVAVFNQLVAIGMLTIAK